jgi:hypothetical protein
LLSVSVIIDNTVNVGSNFRVVAVDGGGRISKSIHAWLV